MTAPGALPAGFPSTAYKLHWKEMIMAAHAGVLRRAENIYKNTPVRHATEATNSWSFDIDGCIGELVVARMLDRFWSPGKTHLYDLEEAGIEVRSSRHERASLILHEDDHDDVPYVLVWLHGAYAYPAGWCYGKHGKRECYWRTDVRSPAYFVPREDLSPMNYLYSDLRRIHSEGEQDHDR